MTRTTFDGFKKVNGLRWQCEQCIDDYTGIWTKLDELTSVVNEIKSLINLCGLVKSAISEAFRDHGPTTSPSNNNCPAATNFNSQPAVKRSIRRRGTAKKNCKIVDTTQQYGYPVIGEIAKSFSAPINWIIDRDCR